VEQPPGPGHVIQQLGDERIDTVETAFAPQEISKRDPARLPVQVAVEIDQVRLE
jgi:hypothetical protein